MALSNILNEPRREITETLVGLIVVGALVAAPLWLAYVVGVDTHERAVARGADNPIPVLVAALLFLVFEAVVLLIGGGIAVGIHAAGEGVCNALDRRGIRLRPARR